MSALKKIAMIIAALGASTISSVATAAPGDLLVSPVRVVFEGRDRVAEVNLVNKGEKPATYRIEFVNRRMNRDGSFMDIEAPENGEKFSEKFVRYAPRKITLAPNSPQTVRLMLRKPADLESGEYRSHLHFAAVPDKLESTSIESQNENTDSISIQLTPIYGVTIPVIVRHGDLVGTAKITNVDFRVNPNGIGQVSFDFHRTGDKSLYGDFLVYADGEPEPVAQKRGVALYHPNDARGVAIPVAPEVAAGLRGRALTVKFQDRTASGADIKAVGVSPAP